MKTKFIEQILIFFSVSKWVILSSMIGMIIGAVVTFFLNIIHFTEDSQSLLPFPSYYLLPFGLMLTVFVINRYAPNAKGHGTEKVIEAVHKRNGKIEAKVIPIKLVATVITIFSGGSVGKEGPGAQIGAGTASLFSQFFKFSTADRKKLVICGISAGFATVFGTPISGAIFGVEVLIVGIIMYDVLLPSFIAAFSAYATAKYLGVHYETFHTAFFTKAIQINFTLILEVMLAGLFFGLIAFFLITFLKKTEHLIKKININSYIKAFLGGTLLVLISFVIGDQYFGLGLNVINDLFSDNSDISQNVPWYSFIAKTFYTSVTLGAGGSGGIITPIFYVGATSGHLFGSLIDVEHIRLFAALGLTAVLAGATNSPIAAIIMAIELFGIEIAHYAAISSVIAFLISGHRSVFPSQVLKMSKSSMLNIHYGDNIDESEVDLSEKSKQKIEKHKRRIKNFKHKIDNRKKFNNPFSKS